MSDRPAAVFKRGSLRDFSFGERLTIRAADIAFYLAIRLIGPTLRISAENEHVYQAVLDSGKQPIVVIWHDRIFASVWHMRDRGLAVLTSKSKDGEYIARFITRFGFGAIRGSSSRGGVKGLVEMIRLMREGIPMAFTVDGPRGPRHVAKSGSVMLAKKTGNPILPLSIDCSSYWTIKSWDRLQIPKPFARARVIFSEPIYVSEETGDLVIEDGLRQLQTALDEITQD